jgi:hypothetical protein
MTAVPDEISRHNGFPGTSERGRWDQTIIRTTLALAVVASFVVYRPDRNLPFDFIDFSEFLPLLESNESFWGRFSSLTSYYGGHGRLNLLGYASIAVKWDLWGSYSPGWQWARFITMWLVILMLYGMLRRLRVNMWGSLAGASLLLFSPPAIDGWTRLTMAEPIGTVLLLAGCHLALQPVDSGSSRWRAIAFGCVCATMMLLKEMMVATLVLPVLLLAIEYPGRRETRSRIKSFFAAALVSVLLAGTPVVLTMMRATGDAYTTAFGHDLRSGGDLLANWLLGLLPLSPGTALPAYLIGLALITILALYAGGWALQLRAPYPTRARLLLGVAIGFPLLGALTYLPWPSYNRFYSIPYLAGGAILAGVALSEFTSRSRPIRSLAIGSWVVLLFFGGADAAAQARRQAARQQINAELVRRVGATWTPSDTVLVATDQETPAAWQGIGPTLERYGKALGHAMPTIQNAPCQAARDQARGGTTGVLFFHSLCPLDAAGAGLARTYRILRLPSFRLETDSIRVDFAIGRGRAPSRSGDGD